MRKELRLSYWTLRVRDLANSVDGVLADECVLICDRDQKWSRGVLAFLGHEGVRIIRTPFNSDVSDSWEREAEDASYFYKFSIDGYRVA